MFKSNYKRTFTFQNFVNLLLLKLNLLIRIYACYVQILMSGAHVCAQQEASLRKKFARLSTDWTFKKQILFSPVRVPLKGQSHEIFAHSFVLLIRSFWSQILWWASPNLEMSFRLIYINTHLNYLESVPLREVHIVML